MAKNPNLPATRPSAGLSTPAALPDWMKADGNLGNENVSRNDINIPRMTILQALSPELDPSDVAKYVEGAKVGEIFNTLTKEHSPSIKVVNCHFEKQFAVFKRRKEGGGFRGTFSTMEEALAKAENPDNPDDDGKLEVIEQDVHYVLLLDDDLNPYAEAAIVFTSTKFKISRNWNSFITLQKGPRFAGAWELSTVGEKNTKGSFFNFRSPAPLGWVSQETYARAKALYEAVSSGAKKLAQEQETDHVDLDSRI